ncbi:MAG TPA: ATP-binding protein, partial [Candidatus Eisenbacteria bacterium]|nr:ATP-binding protein [Candidatus Eisenbacteria bacterium]
MRYIDPFTKKKLNRYYGLKRQVAEREHDRMLDLLYIRYPELKTLENARISAGLAELKNSINSNLAINQKQTKSLDEVEAEIQNFLDQHDIPSDYQEIRYDCPYCQDTGWAGDDYCPCVEKSLNEINQADNLFLPPKNTKFSDFELAVFSDARQAEFFQGRMSPREAMKGIKAWLTQYVNNFTENKANLFLFGSPGTGKTFMMGCVANSLLNQGHSVVFIKAVQLFELL